MTDANDLDLILDTQITKDMIDGEIQTQRRQGRPRQVITKIENGEAYTTCPFTGEFIKVGTVLEPPQWYAGVDIQEEQYFASYWCATVPEAQNGRHPSQEAAPEQDDLAQRSDDRCDVGGSPH